MVAMVTGYVRQWGVMEIGRQAVVGQWDMELNNGTIVNNGCVAQWVRSSA